KTEPAQFAEGSNCTGAVSGQVSLYVTVDSYHSCNMKLQTLASHTALQLNGVSNLYERVALRISELIEHGTLRAGERIPSVRQCSAQQDVSIATVMQAYRVLEDRGMIEGRPQSGYYVRAQRWAPPLEPEMTQPALGPINVEASDLILQLVRAGTDAT